LEIQELIGKCLAVETHILGFDEKDFILFLGIFTSIHNFLHFERQNNKFQE